MLSSSSWASLINKAENSQSTKVAMKAQFRLYFDNVWKKENWKKTSSYYGRTSYWLTSVTQGSSRKSWISTLASEQLTEETVKWNRLSQNSCDCQCLENNNLPQPSAFANYWSTLCWQLAIFFSTPFPMANNCSFFCVNRNRIRLCLFLMQVYQANSNKTSIVTNKFSSPRSAEWISIAPKSWLTCIALRLEVYGY